MYWSAGALVALLCGDTVTLSNEDKFPEGINKVYKILKILLNPFKALGSITRPNGF